jgi:type VI secretion system protein VasD
MMRATGKHRSRLTGTLLACLATLALHGCGSSPTRVEADIVASTDVNRGRPIVVRLYELKTTGSFEGSDFYSLYDREAATLGGDLMAREELNLSPGQRQRVERATAPDTQYVGVVAAYRDIDHARWRASYPLRPNTTNKIKIKLGPDNVSIH